MRKIKFKAWDNENRKMIQSENILKISEIIKDSVVKGNIYEDEDMIELIGLNI